MKNINEKQDIGDFEEIEEGIKKPLGSFSEEAPARVKMPRGKEVIGMVIQRLGGNRMEIKTTSGKKMNCRVPGRFKRSMWLKVRDIVLIEPWEHDESKGDVIFKYNFSAISQLRKRGLLESLKEEF